MEQMDFPKEITDLNNEQIKYLYKQGYYTQNKQTSNSCSTKRKQLEYQQKQIENLQNIIQERQNKINLENQKNKEDNLLRLQRMKQKIDNDYAQNLKNRQLTSQKKMRAQQNMENLREQKQKEREERLFQIAVDEERTKQLINEKIQNKLDSLELLKQKDEQNRMKVQLAKQIQQFKDQKALNKWTQYKNFIQSLTTQKYQMEIENQRNIFQ